MKFAAIFLGIEGRLNRLSYSLLFILLAALYLLFMYIIMKVVVIGSDNTLPLHILDIISYIIFIFLTIKRCHDFNKSGFFMIIPPPPPLLISPAGIFLLINLDGFSVDRLIIMGFIIKAVFWLYLVLKPGTNGKNQYGSQPEKLFDLGIDSFTEKK